jgi:hypothetical protein
MLDEAIFARPGENAAIWLARFRLREGLCRKRRTGE